MTTDGAQAVRIEHERLSSQLIEQVRRGDAPWQRPVSTQSVLPYNPRTGKRYRGVNLLALLAHSRGDPRWLTHDQAIALGGRIREGERGALVHCWQFFEHRSGQERRPLTHPRLATAVVYNADQVDGLAAQQAATLDNDERGRVQQLFDSAAASVAKSSSVAQYDPASDTLLLPQRTKLLAEPEQAARALHALARWTGHPSRLARAVRAPVGSVEAAGEELRAALYARLCAHELGLELTHSPRPELIESWVRLLERDPLEIGRAAADAERVRAYILETRREPNRATQSATVPPAKEASMEEKPRQYLAVPYADRERASALGARYDREAKCWYVGPRADRDALERWMPTGRNQPLSSDAREEFAAMLRGLGLEVTGAHPIMDGRRHRLRAEGDRGREVAGYYIGNLDGIPNGFAGNYRTGQTSPWSARGQVHSAEELAELRAQAAQAAAAREAERRRLELISAVKVQVRIAPAPELVQLPIHVRSDDVRADRAARLSPLAADSDLPYLTRKQIRATRGVYVIQNTLGRQPDWWPFAGWPCREGTICLPARDTKGTVWSMQYIAPDGAKRFEPNSFKRGCFHVIDSRELSPLSATSAIVIAEGYATAKTLHDVLQDPRVAVIAGFDSGNLPAVATALRARLPRMPIVVAGDNDERLLHRPPHKNVGQEKAHEAAEAVNGVAITPTFPKGSDPERTDFNDLAALGASHRAAIAQQLRVALERARRQIHAHVDVRRHTLTRSVRM